MCLEVLDLKIFSFFTWLNNYLIVSLLMDVAKIHKLGEMKIMYTDFGGL